MTIWELALLFFVFIPLAILWFRTIMDIFDRRDLSGVQKAVWLFAVVAIPLIGVLGYLFTRPVTDQDRERFEACLLYTSPSPRDKRQSRMPSSA